MDWSSLRSGSPLVRTPPQSVLVGDALTTLGIEGGHEINPITLQPSHPISEQTHIGVAGDVIQEVHPTACTVQ